MNVPKYESQVLLLEEVWEGLETTWNTTIFWIQFFFYYIIMRNVISWKKALIYPNCESVPVLWTQEYGWSMIVMEMTVIKLTDYFCW